VRKAHLTKVIILCFVFLYALSFVGCTLTPQVAYDNFITDLDVLYRMEEIAFNVEFGRYSGTWQREIEALKKDLETFDINDEEALRINNMFIKSADAFLTASQLFLQGSDQARYEAYDLQAYAVSKYREANDAYHEYIDDEGDLQ